MRRLAVSVCAALLLGSATAPALAKPPPVALSDCLLPEVRPEVVLLACGDGTQSFDVVRWTRWTRRSARAVGTAEINDCTPSCVDGHVHHHRAVLLADRPRICGGRWLFTRVQLSLAGRGGVGQSMGQFVMCHV